MRNAVEQLTEQLSGVSTGTPRLEATLNRLRVTATEIKQKLVTNRRQLGALRSNDSRLGDVLDNAARRAHVLGRISLYLETVPEASDIGDLQTTITTLQHQIDVLREELSDERSP